MRLSLLYALLDCSPVVTLEHLHAALALWLVFLLLLPLAVRSQFVTAGPLVRGQSFLSAVFGSDRPFTSSSDNLPGVVRAFANFQTAAEEAGQSRVYGGIHFEFDNSAGLSSGRQVGQYVVDNFLRPIPV